ncbi:uncharacterized protein [Porites lutea]|uniref:uncharacterized protein n=1 Tax=Porites lutea TaxID=51062 RepID=UPI003CC626FA
MSFGRGFGQSGNQSFDGSRPSKFLYNSGKNKKNDPWRTDDPDIEDGLELALQPKNKFLKTKDNRNLPGSELDGVWSIRKNVQVSQASKNGTFLNTNKSTPSYYSRHGGLSGSGDAESSALNRAQNDEFLNSSGDHKSWSMARSSNFSYSDKPKFGGGFHASSADTQPDDFLDSRSSPSTDHEINDMVHKKNLLNSKLRMAGAPQISTREMSARTRRAKKMHDAHLRSMGLGQYTPSGNGSYISPGEEQNKDDDF